MSGSEGIEFAGTGFSMDRIRRLIVPAAAVILIAAAVIFFVKGGSSGSSEKVSEGIHYLKSLEEEDIQVVEDLIAAQQRERRQSEKEEIMRQVEAGGINVWSLFTDYVLMGDSRAVGFSYYGFMPEERVIAGGGWTIRDIAEHIDEIRAVNPTSIFLCFGLNDTSIGYWDTPDAYAAEYLEVIRNLQEEFPNATVYVSSILPAKEVAFATSEKWREIPEYSAAVGNMCAGNGIPFVNNDAIAEKYASLWDPDGIHLMEDFYPMWAADLIMAVYGDEPGESTPAPVSEGAEEADQSEDTVTEDYE